MKPRLTTQLLQAVIISTVAAALTTVGVFLAAYLLFPLEGVKVSGNRMLPESRVHELVSERSSLLTLNARMLEHEIESDPWVESVEVWKDWASSIVVVEVKERRAILSGEIEGERVIMADDGEELPGPGGAELSEVEVDGERIAGIVEAASTFEEAGMRLDSIDAVGPGGIQATVEGRSVIFSGEVREGQARVLEGVMRENPGDRIFDLRSPDRVVVSAEKPPATDQTEG